jgi:beta-aspartyl-peptidase (threonine type)
VGCVALDQEGNLAAATSTGGLSNKQYGRVGDSPIVGAGTYADNATCAVSCTGVGEEYIRRAIAYDIAAQMRYAGTSIDQAAHEILTHRLEKGTGGIIAVDKTGKITMQFNTGGMPRAAADSEGRFEVLWSEGP